MGKKRMWDCQPGGLPSTARASSASRGQGNLLLGEQPSWGLRPGEEEQHGTPCLPGGQAAVTAAVLLGLRWQVWQHSTTRSHGSQRCCLILLPSSCDVLQNLLCVM